MTGDSLPAAPGPAASFAHLVRDVPDYPHAGILFKDITPLLADAAGFAAAVRALGGAHHEDEAVPVDLVAGIEARGFILAAPVAHELKAGFVPIRKVGKLPWETVSASYDLEYGQAEIEMHVDSVRPGQRVLVVDDVLATGGTAAAAIDLVRRLGGEVVEVVVLLELVALGGRARLEGCPVRSLIQV